MFTWQFIPEHELVPYAPTSVMPQAGLTVLAPHPDDEVFGCGGTLALASEANLPVSVIVATAGDKGGDAAVRERESRRAADAIAAGAQPLKLAFWGLGDRELVPDDQLVARIRDALRQQPSGWLLAPSPFEVHPDHRALCLAAIEAAAGLPVELGFYEIGQALMPNRLVDITRVMPRKRAAMACFESQLSAQRYDAQVEAMNRVRSYTLGPDVSFAEAFWFPPPSARAGVPQMFEALSGLLAWRMGVGERPA